MLFSQPATLFYFRIVVQLIGAVLRSRIRIIQPSLLFSSGRGTSARTRFLSPYAFPHRRPRARRRARRSLPPPRGARRADRKGVPPRGAASRRAGGEGLPPIRPAHHRRGARMVRNALRPCFHLCVRHVELEEARSEAQPSVTAEYSPPPPTLFPDHIMKQTSHGHFPFSRSRSCKDVDRVQGANKYPRRQ